MWIWKKGVVFYHGLKHVNTSLFHSPSPGYPNLGQLSQQCNSVRVHTYSLSTSYACAQTLSIYTIWMWRRSEGSCTASTMSKRHYSTMTSPDHPNQGQHGHQGNGAIVHTYAFPQHMNGLKHNIYNRDVEKKYLVLFSLNHVNTSLFQPTIPRSPKSGSTCWPAV